MNRFILVLLLLTLCTACTDGDERYPQDAAALFRALIVDPIPPQTNNLASTGYINEGGGHNVYVRFNTSVAFLESLLALRDYQPVACDDEQLLGRLTLPQGLEDDINNWFPFLPGELRCYVSEPGYRNAWTNNAASVLLIRTQTLTVYFNETGQ